ncbi:MAG: hypothetical protein Q9168_007930 [Polycauliona sp. 1 TL-2023]
MAVLGVSHYRPGHQAGIAANLLQRDTHNIPIPNTPVTDVGQHGSQQNPEMAPPLPIIALSEFYIQAIVNNTFPDFPPLNSPNTTFSSNSTPRVQPRDNAHGQKHARFHLDTSPAVVNPLLKRGEAEPCHKVPPPTCAEGAGSANARTIGYYQASNTRDRLCNRISPSAIDIEGLTHLYFAFAKIDPTTYSIVSDNPADVDLYTPFTRLQSSSLQTWIAVGGFDFSDPGPTRTTWSEIAGDSTKRAAFINSCMAFMAKYGFQGIDIDWEYPGSDERGGTRADIPNFVTLVKDMRAAFGTTYGLSLTLAPDYWYLRFFDAKAMEPYVDHFGFMAYDLHGSWDADVKTLGSIVRAQTDVREIYNDTLPLWFDGLDPKKINFGLAYYGRGYTLSNPSCNQLECPFAGPSLPGPCTHYSGVLSLAEIKQYILEKKLTPQLIEGAMIKQITWDDQWIGYDDEDTTAMKSKWASGYCFGGTMIWSVDFKSGSGSAVLRPASVAEDPNTVAMAANQEPVLKGSEPPTAPVVLCTAVQSAVHGPGVLAAHPAATVEIPMLIAAKAVYPALATMQPTWTVLPATSTSIPASGRARNQPSRAFRPASTFFHLRPCRR